MMSLKKLFERLVLPLIDDQRIRFIMVGGVNTAIGYGTFALLVGLGMHYFIANICSTVIAVAISYLLNKYFTFQQYKKSYSEIIRFVTVYVVSFLLGSAMLYCLVDWLSLSPYLAGGINLVFTTLISWFGHRYFSFRSARSR